VFQRSRRQRGSEDRVRDGDEWARVDRGQARRSLGTWPLDFVATRYRDAVEDEAQIGDSLQIDGIGESGTEERCSANKRACR
jgi:hypothetical protein